jgi:hypothetical protein
LKPIEGDHWVLWGFERWLFSPSKRKSRNRERWSNGNNAFHKQGKKLNFWDVTRHSAVGFCRREGGELGSNPYNDEYTWPSSNDLLRWQINRTIFASKSFEIDFLSPISKTDQKRTSNFTMIERARSNCCAIISIFSRHEIEFPWNMK